MVKKHKSIDSESTPVFAMGLECPLTLYVYVSWSAVSNPLRPRGL